MRLFISAGEPSGDLHGANLIRALRERCPDAEFVGFGGERMSAAECSLLFPLCQLSFMGFRRIFKHLATFFRLVGMADRCFRDQRPDAVVLIDYPGFHWWLARKAHARGIPVVYFVPPQLWAWAGWRVRKMRKWVDHVLTCLPFEQEWYKQRRVAAHYIGHPYFDELRHQHVDESFLAEQRARPGRVVAMLPGSRMQEVQDNFPTFIRVMERIHARHPDVRFLVAAFNEPQRLLVEKTLGNCVLPVETHCQRTPEIIRLATACLAVSGSVGLELLFGLVPTVVQYRVSNGSLWLARRLMTTRYISLVNLLAGAELFPEFLSAKCEAADTAEHISRWLADETARLDLQERLRELRDCVAQPGACARAAEFILRLAAERNVAAGTARAA